MGVRLSVAPREGALASSEDRPHEPAVYEFDQDRITIGRGAGADVLLPHVSVSVRHATIELRDGRYVIVDHRSTNGTSVNGAALVAERAKPLRDGDRLDVGVFALHWKERVAVAQVASAERTASLARRLLRSLLGAEPPRGASLYVIDGPDRGRVFEIPPPPVLLVIGRAETCDFALSDPDASREHIELAVDLDGVIARDLGSKNGLLVNDRPVAQKRLSDRDELTIGGTRLTYEDPAEAAVRAAEQGEDQLDERPDPPAPPPAPPEEEDDPETPTGETAPPPPPSPRRAVTSTEAMVFALALVVFSASLFGLFLLMSLRG